MSYFSDVVQVKDKDGFIQVSIRVSQVRVDEYLLAKSEIQPILQHPIPMDWGFDGVVGVKAKPLQRSVLVRFRYGLKSEVHLLSMVDFSMFQSQTRAILAGQGD